MFATDFKRMVSVWSAVLSKVPIVWVGLTPLPIRQQGSSTQKMCSIHKIAPKLVQLPQAPMHLLGHVALLVSLDIPN